MTPDEIEQLFSSSSPRGSPKGEEERAESLDQVLATVRHLWETGAKELDVVAEKIGNGSRDGCWRIPLGESQLLDFFIRIVGADGLSRPLTIHTLRIIGNSCADTDQNRQRVVAAECLPKIVKLLRDDSLLPLVIPVLFNICVDHEPAQIAAYKAGLNPELISLLSGPRFSNAESSMGIICKLLRLVAGQEPEADLAHPETPYTLMKLAAGQESSADLEDFLGQSSVALTYLAHQQFQDAFLEKPNVVPMFLQVFSRICGEFRAAQLDPEEQGQLKQTQSVFMQVLADLSAHTTFAAACPLDGPEVQTLRDWVSSSPSPLQSAAACLALGNMARSDATCVSLIEDYEIHKPLIATLSNPSNTDAQLLHSVLGFLKNLSIPTSNKAALGGAGLFDAHVLPRLWRASVQPQVQFSAVSLTRLLLVNCPGNVKRICAAAVARSSPNLEDLKISSPARDDNDDDVDDDVDQETGANLQVLLGVFAETDQEPTKMEAARAVLSVCRALHTDTSSIFPPGENSGSSDLQLRKFYDDHTHIPSGLLFLGSQKKYPLLRSELWFVLALMAQSAAGARVVAGLTQHHELLVTLSEAVTGKDILEVEGQESNADSVADDFGVQPGPSELGLEPQQVDPKQAASMARVDRENGLVLINEVLSQELDDTSSLPLDSLRRILKEGGDLVLATKNTA